MIRLAGLARARGLSFEEFWSEAVRPGLPAITPRTPPEKTPQGCVLWPSDSFDGRLWRDATKEIKEGWRRAYDRVSPSPGELALVQLEPLLRQVTAVSPDGRTLVAA